MNAVSVYVHIAQLLLRLDTNNTVEQFSDLNRLLGHLRQLLACAVCSRLLNDPFAPRDKNCNHNVCRVCIRGRKCLRPPCIDCKDCQDFKTYVENPQMRCLLLCFKSLCEHIMGAQNLFQQLCRQKQSLPAVVSSQPSTVPISQMSTQEYIIEGANYADITSAFTTDLPRNTPMPRLHIPQTATGSQIPPLATSVGVPTSMPISALHLLAQTQTAPKASTPPTNALSNNTNNNTNNTLSSIVIKQERNPIITNPTLTPPPPPLSVVNSSTILSNFQQTNQQTTTALGVSQPLSVKHYVKHVPNNTTTASLSSNSLTSTINYIGPNTPGVVVPIVSSSITTHAPLSIASSRLQSLNRHLAQNRRPTTAVSNEAVPPLAFKVSLAPTSSASSSSTNSIQTLATTSTATVTATTTATVTSQQVRNPPPIKTVSNGSAMYSVLYTGIGNKITIKRKTDGDEDTTAVKKTVSTSTNTTNTPVSSAVYRQVTISKTANQTKRRGCRCGNATPTPGKLTCCGQRCPCYVESKSCIGCKCRGCRNPHRPDGGKVRPVIPELACYEIQMADESSSQSPPDPPIATVTTTLPILKNNTKTHQQQQHQNFNQYEVDLKPSLASLVSHMNSTSSTNSVSNNNSNNNNNTTTITPTATLIPFKTLQTTSQTTNLQNIQRINTLSGNLNNTINHHQQQQQLQQTQFVSTSNITTKPTTSTSNVLQLENLQRESVLIQNADGQYQVVNLFTTGGSSNNHNNLNSTQLTPIQRIHTISNANSLNTTATSSTSGLQQIFVQQQQQQQQSSQQQTQHRQNQNNFMQRIITNATTTNVVQTPSPSPPTATITTTSIQQLQQQLKQQNNLITMHSLATTNFHQQQQQQQHHTSNITTTAQTPLISPQSVASTCGGTTITLSPIIVTSPNTLTSDMFSSSDGSGDEFITINNLASAAMATATASTSPNISNGSNSTTHLITMPTATDSTQFSTISIDGIDGSSNTMIPTSAGVQLTSSTTAHLTPALVEVIDSNEL